MKNEMRPAALVFGTIAMSTIMSQSLPAAPLNETGSSILAPVIAPTGGYASNPQEYLTVSWSVVENLSDVYTYTYTVHNPAGDVLMNDNGSLTTTPEVFDAFSVGFNTTAPGAYLTGTQTGSPSEEVNPTDLTWFFDPSIPAGSNSPAVTFQSDLPPVPGASDASDGSPPSPWSVSALASTIPVPGKVSDVMSTGVLGVTVLMLAVVRGKGRKQPTLNRD